MPIPALIMFAIVFAFMGFYVMSQKEILYGFILLCLCCADVTWICIGAHHIEENKTVKTYPIKQTNDGTTIQFAVVDGTLVNIQEHVNCVADVDTQELEITKYGCSYGIDWLETPKYRVIPKKERN